jgi:hypothetical protein
MNEAAWLNATDPMPMLVFLRGKASDRKLRLFGVACCRRIWHRLSQGPTRLGRVPGLAERVATPTELTYEAVERAEAVAGPSDFNHDAVELAERFADGGASRQALNDAIPVFLRFDIRNEPLDGDHAFQTWQVLLPDAHVAAAKTAWAAAVGSDLPEAIEKSAQAALLRDMFGNPFAAPRRIEAAWLRWNDGTVRRIAQGLYDERAFGRMPILADALLDAGCDNDDILAHCRQQGAVHAKGCWVIDLLLGRS